MINYMPARNVYPTSAGPSLGDIATGELMGPSPAQIEVSGELEQALSIGGQASPLLGAALFLVLALATMLIAQRFGKDSEFANLRATAYNAFVVGWLAILTIPMWKFLFTKVKLPGVSTWVHSV